MRTTVELRDDLYTKIIEGYGKRRISETLNRILDEHFNGDRAAEIDRMFGSAPWLTESDLTDVRDKHDRDL